MMVCLDLLNASSKSEVQKNLWRRLRKSQNWAGGRSIAKLGILDNLVDQTEQAVMSVSLFGVAKDLSVKKYR